MNDSAEPAPRRPGAAGDDAPRTGAAAPQRLRTSVGVGGTAVIAMANTAPTLSIGIGLGLISLDVGAAVPAMVLLAVLPVLGIALAFSRLNRSERNLGASYTWVGRTLSPWLGFQCGWVNLAGSTIYLAYGSQVCGSMVLGFADECHWTSVLGLALNPTSIALTTAVGLVVLIGLTYLALRGADVVARLQTPLIAFEYLVLIGFCGYAAIRGTHPIAASWFNPFTASSPKLAATGIILCVYCFWGWDSAFTLTEETRGPRDSARAGFGSIFLMLGMFLLAAVGFERYFSLSAMGANGAQLLPYLGTQLAKQPLAAFPLLAMLFSSVASLQTGVLPNARGALAMGRDGTLGRVWTRVSPKYGTPALGSLLIAGVAAAIAVLGIGIGTLNQFVQAMATSVGILVSGYYGLAGLACAWRFRRELRAGLRTALGSVVLPTISALLLLGLGAFLAVSDWQASTGFALNAQNGRFLAAVPMAVVAVGIALSGWAKWGRRSRYFAAGGDGVGDLATVDGQPNPMTVIDAALATE
ncbi:MAG TPA: APC family permease [Actinospica sp.]|jgi:amino acid transporter|nr:APC family permease [Actinospica sp.]